MDFRSSKDYNLFLFFDFLSINTHQSVDKDTDTDTNTEIMMDTDERIAGWVIGIKKAPVLRVGLCISRLHTKNFINIANDFVEKFIAISLHFRGTTRIRSVFTGRLKIDD